ncbi:MAG: HEAT repeat domain-containing protein [Candidatus Heimdallarchaeota archaeon]
MSSSNKNNLTWKNLQGAVFPLERLREEYRAYIIAYLHASTPDLKEHNMEIPEYKRINKKRVMKKTAKEIISAFNEFLTEEVEQATSVKALYELLKDEHEMVRGITAAIIGEIGHSEDISEEVLRELINMTRGGDENLWVNESAKEALDSIARHLGYTNRDPIIERYVSLDEINIAIKQGLTTQYKSMFELLQQALDNVSTKHWYVEKNDWNYAYFVYHTIEAIEFYFRDTPTGMKWRKLLGTKEDFEKNKKAYYPTKERIKEYLAEIQELSMGILENISYQKLLEQDGFKKFNSVFEKFIYLLRHCHQHIGELALKLREWKSERVKWK